MDFCLEIDKYSKGDLYDIFELKESEVNHLNIHRKCLNYIDEIESNSKIELVEKLPLVDFLKKAMNQLIVFNNTSTVAKQDFTGDLEKNKTYHGEHFLIQKNPKSNLTSMINPINRTLTASVLNINTMFRGDYYSTKSSNFNIDLNNNLQNVTSMTLQSAEIPDLYYTFSSLNKTNEFTIELFDVSSNNADNAIISDDVSVINETKHVIKIKDGIYTPHTLMRYLNEYVFNDPSNNQLTRIGAYYDEVTKKFNFVRDIRGSSNSGIPVTNLDGDMVELRFNIDWRISDEPNRPIQMNMGWMLGYRKQYYNYVTDFVNRREATTNTVHGYSPEGMFNTEGSKYLFLAIDDYNKNYSQTIFSPFQESVFTNNTILAKLVKTADGNYNYVNPDVKTNYIRKYFGPVNISRLNVSILDELGRIVDFNNTDYSISLRLEQLYDLNSKNA
mgnify:FL=1|tara:strand:+ start:874 stop:2205 length:1332 start_codon:yes stop_codon:yes gene_type:complete